jgi:hypothetical protein
LRAALQDIVPIELESYGVQLCGAASTKQT